MSDLNIAVPNNAPPSTKPKAVEINVLKSSAVEDLRATFTEIQNTFNIQTPDFYNKLGDLMLSSQTFSVSSFKSRFFNLLNEYSNGVVMNGEEAAVFEGIANPKTGEPVDGELGQVTNPKTGEPVDGELGQITNPKTGEPVDGELGQITNPKTGKTVDGELGQVTNPKAGEPVDGELGQVTNPKTGKTYVEYKSYTSLPLTPETNSVQSFDTPQERKSSDEQKINVTPAEPKDIAKSSNILIENALENLWNLANRTKTINNIDIFLYNTIPLLAGGAMASIISGVTPTEKMTLPIKQAINLFMAGKYFTPAELAYLAVASFYTLTLKRGISIKDLTTGPGIEFSPNITMSKPENIIAGKRSTSREYRLSYLDKDEERDSFQSTNKGIGKSTTLTPSKIDLDLSTYRTNWAFKSGDGTKDVDIISLEEEERKARGIWSIGCIYVWPIDREIGKNTISPSVIPFEFNPAIGEGDVSARYQSMAILSRIGDLQSYTGTNSLSVSVSTSYYALGEKEADIPNPSTPAQLSHLSYYSLERLQKIEQGYRSLVLPYHGEDSQVDKDTGYRYVRPPLVKIIMGDYREAESETSNPYSNLLLYPSAVIGDKFKNIGDNKFRKYKTFICTSVKIDKSPETYPYYIKDNYVKDTMGFGIDLSLIEVSPSYAQSLPSFLKTYNAAQLQKTTGGV